jgi:hypothetical protein
MLNIGAEDVLVLAIMVLVRDGAGLHRQAMGRSPPLIDVEVDPVKFRLMLHLASSVDV